MLMKSLNGHLSSVMILIRCSSIVRSNSDLGSRMKLLNDNKQFEKTLELFAEHKKTNNGTFSSFIITQALKACTHLGDLQSGKNIQQLISSSLKGDSYLLASLIHLYMQCGEVESAQSLFDRARNRSSGMYGAMMKGYIKNNLSNKAIDLFNEIPNPNEIILNLLFNACAELGTSEALNVVKKVSESMSKSCYSNVHIITSLLDALMKCGDVEGAQSLFNGLPKKALPMYGAMIKGYIENEMINRAIDLFKEIRSPSEVNLIVLFNGCAHLRSSEALDLVKKVWKEMPSTFYSNSRLLTSLLDALIKCGDCSSAEILFRKMRKSVANYGNLMNGFNLEKNPLKTLELFSQMKQNGIEANLIIYLCLIKALSSIGDSSISEAILKEMPSDYLLNRQICNALIDLWGKIGDVHRAQGMFEKFPQPDHIGYTAMINSYGLNGMGNQAIELYRQMPKELIDQATHTCVLNACSHSGLVQEARLIFEKISLKSENIYCTMIDCFSRASFFEEAQQLIDEYERDHSPVLSMYMALLSGARNEKNIPLSENVYHRMKKLFPQMTNPLTAAAVLLANVYASSGHLDKASDIKLQLHKSGGKKQVGLSWTAVNGQIFQFRAHDQSHPRSREIYGELEKISSELLEHGHQYDSSWITRTLDQDETVVSVLCGHSERLAIAWNFVENPNVKRIQVTKNLRVCGDCHRATKLLANIRQCEIIVRDANRIHHFHTNGQCSCNDYF